MIQNIADSAIGVSHLLIIIVAGLTIVLVNVTIDILS
jgi:hypothetical protein